MKKLVSSHSVTAWNRISGAIARSMKRKNHVSETLKPN